MPKTWRTAEAAKEIGVTENQLRYALRQGYIKPPRRRDPMTFEWTWPDLVVAHSWFEQRRTGAGEASDAPGENGEQDPLEELRAHWRRADER